MSKTGCAGIGDTNDIARKVTDFDYLTYRLLAHLQIGDDGRHLSMAARISTGRYAAVTPNEICRVGIGDFARRQIRTDDRL